ncbi:MULTISPECIES: 3-isopropylmalate dehydratase small subunit [Ramlibacter]|uniref:3-isopropylmalate dehydratase n=1 Tax=Ramlibacter pinisoli TaxID=2682844 RepID=A0A6N8IQW1_9BURK|nr:MULTISPECIES: 3-isopropylmalate dehydratase small subunit [Ramlibacter]MBA2963561.1 3-isopropylmalate dehydratase small subunit [Ramlibacter sp. CGMCC 1.13660]MVQ28526.1 3-isopropylmalate dehydratase small subunit [Ramlibacter pinisoli]
MEPFRTLTGPAAPLPMANLDTDQIMPKQFLRGVDRESGLAGGFLHDLRFDEQGRARPQFVLNRAPWTQARLLVTGPNYGCGSSREHAVWGMLQLGLRCVIGSSFGGIFADNCIRNGVPAICVPAEEAERLLALAADPQRCQMTVDLEAQTITTAGDGCILPFRFDARHRSMLLRGLDAVGLTLEMADDIRRFESGYLQDAATRA